MAVAQGIIERNVCDNRQAWEARCGSAEAAELSWGTTDISAMGAPWSAPDFVIAADVIYDRALFQPLLSTLSAYGASSTRPTLRFARIAECVQVTVVPTLVCMTGAGTEILLAHVRRWTSDRRFFRMLRSARFAVEDATCSQEDGGDNGADHTTAAGADGGNRKGGSLHERGACRIFRIHRTKSRTQGHQVRMTEQQGTKEHR